MVWVNNMCDVVFVTLNMNNTVTTENMGTMELATILHSKGISCEILPFWKIGDLNDFENFINNAIKIIDEKKPKIVSFYTRCDFYHIELRLAERIKERLSDIYIVFGGPQADITSEDTIRKIPYVDFVCCGEGENTVYPLFSSLLKGEPDLSVDGLVYREGDIVKKNPRPALVEDMDSLPIVDFSLANYDNMLQENIFAVEVGRGCHFGCTFCSTNSFWGRKYRLKSPQRIVDEIKLLHEKMGITKFAFMHDMFTFKKSTVMEVCKLLKTLDFPVEWSCSARLDCLDYEMIDAMIDSGMYNIYFGVETGSPRMQKLINKNLKIENAVEIIDYLNNKNVDVITSFIYGYPEETEEDISYTLSLIGALLNLKNVEINTHLCAFLPQTPLTQKYKDFLVPTQQYSNFTGEYAIEECKDIIDNNPELFAQVMEYKTELRSKLRYFAVFIRLWKLLSPIFQYMSESYSSERKIEMYFDFVEDNREILENNENLPVKEFGELLIKNDKFKLRWASDANYDIISDYYRLHNMLCENNSVSGYYGADVFCFDPKEAKKQLSIRDYNKGSYVVVCNNGKVASFPKK